MKIKSSETLNYQALKVRVHLFHIGLLLLICGGLLPLLYASQDMLSHPFTNTADATIYAAVGFRVNNPNLYKSDFVISAREQDFFTIFYALLPDAWETLDSINTTYAGLGLGFGLIFGLGTYLLTWEIFQRRDIALLTALSIMLVERSAMQTPAGWGVRAITPRYTVLGLSPLLLWLYWRWSKSRKVTWVFAAFGILLFMHPRFAIYPVTLMGVGLLLQERPSVRHWTHVAVRILPFIICLAIVLWISFSRLGSEIVSSGNQVSFELSPYDFPSGVLRQVFFSSIDAIVPLGLGLLGWFNKRNQAGIRRDERDALSIFSIVPILIYISLWLLIQWIPMLKHLNIKRFLTWIYLIPYGFSIYWIISSWQEGHLKRRLMAIVACAALLTVTYGNVQSILLKDSVIYRRAVDWVYDRFAPDATREGREVILAEAAQAEDIREDWESFHALCDWTRMNTDVDTVFVIPPRNLSLFRLYSQRSLYSMAKNVGFGTFYESEKDLVWQRYEAATRAYTAGESQAFLQLQFLGRADYVIVERDKLTLDLPLAYENQRYQIYTLPETP
jgi:hypothetical protein